MHRRADRGPRGVGRAGHPRDRRRRVRAAPRAGGADRGDPGRPPRVGRRREGLRRRQGPRRGGAARQPRRQHRLGPAPRGGHPGAAGSQDVRAGRRPHVRHGSRTAEGARRARQPGRPLQRLHRSAVADRHTGRAPRRAPGAPAVRRGRQARRPLGRPDVAGRADARGGDGRVAAALPEGRRPGLVAGRALLRRACAAAHRLPPRCRARAWRTTRPAGSWVWGS